MGRGIDMSTMKECVYLAVTKAISNNAIPYREDVAVVLSEDLFKKVSDEVLTAVLGGKVEHEIPESIMSSSEKLLMYVNGSISAWLRKDIRLNGGYHYYPITSTGLHIAMEKLDTSSKEYKVLSEISSKVAKGEPLSWPEYTRLAKAAYDYGIAMGEDKYE